MKQCHLHRLDVFHRSCVRCILGISRTAQWHEHLQGVSQSKIEGGGRDKRKSSIYNSLVDLNV